MNFEELLQLNTLDNDLADLYSEVQGGRDIMVFSAGEGEKIHISSHLGKFVLFVAKDAFRATTLAGRLADYFGDRVAYLPANEELLLHRATYRKSIVSQRIDTLNKLASGKLDCLVVSPQTLAGYLPSKQAVKEGVVRIKKGDTLDRYDLIDKLALMGYVREDS